MDTVYCQVVDIPIHQIPVPQYSAEEHETWSLLSAAQKNIIPGRGCDEFIEGLKRIDLPENRIPALRDVSEKIQKWTGWTLMRVDGLVHPRDFFKMLAKKVFPSTDFIRKRQDLKYTPAPDMFHDLYGHTPLLTDRFFCDFFEVFGKVGVEAMERFPIEHPIHKQMATLYWYTVEFGLLKTKDGYRSFGSGALSSPEETQYCVSPATRKHVFDAEKVSVFPYDIWHLQEDVFTVESFESLKNQFLDWAAERDIHLGDKPSAS